MKRNRMIRAVFYVLGVCALISFALDHRPFAAAQVKPTFKWPALTARLMDEDPLRAVALLEGILTQEQINQFEKAVLPEITVEQKKTALKNMQAQARLIGITDSKDPLLVQIAAKLNALPLIEAEPIVAP